MAVHGGYGGGGRRGNVPGRTSHRIDPATAEGARRADISDASIYGRPVTPRITSSNLWLSVAVVVLVCLLLLSLLFVFA